MKTKRLISKDILTFKINVINNHIMQAHFPTSDTASIAGSLMNIAQTLVDSKYESEDDKFIAQESVWNAYVMSCFLLDSTDMRHVSQYDTWSYLS